MKAAVARKPVIKIAVVESDPLRFVGSVSYTHLTLPTNREV